MRTPSTAPDNSVKEGEARNQPEFGALAAGRQLTKGGEIQLRLGHRVVWLHHDARDGGDELVLGCNHKSAVSIIRIACARKKKYPASQAAGDYQS